MVVQLMLRHTHNTLLQHTRDPQDILSSCRQYFSLSWLERGELFLLAFSGCREEASLEDAAAAAEPASIWDKKFLCVRKVAASDAPDSAFQRQALRNNPGVRLCQAELSTLPPQVKPKQADRDNSLSQPAVVETVKGKETL